MPLPPKSSSSHLWRPGKGVKELVPPLCLHLRLDHHKQNKHLPRLSGKGPTPTSHLPLPGEKFKHLLVARWSSIKLTILWGWERNCSLVIIEQIISTVGFWGHCLEWEQNQKGYRSCISSYLISIRPWTWSHPLCIKGLRTCSHGLCHPH